MNIGESIQSFLPDTLTQTRTGLPQTTVIPDNSLYIETITGDSVEITPDNWAVNKQEHIVYIDTHSEPNTKYTPNDFATTELPAAIHLPVKTLTAAENRYEKTEATAHSPYTVSRYSYVTNTSNNPDKPHDFTTDFLEVWVKPQTIKHRTEPPQ